ncbi:MAG: phospholipase [Chloroflexi bacterium]|nr:phospholipase [Chloroflexota bacterium]
MGVAASLSAAVLAAAGPGPVLAAPGQRVGQRSAMANDWQAWAGRRQATPGAGRLSARPRPPSESGSGGSQPTGLQPLGLDAERDGLLYIPSSYQPDHPLPLVLMLHGAGGNAQGGMGPLAARAEAAGLILLAIDSRGKTWDVVRTDFGPDVTFIDRALQQTFGRYTVDPARFTVEGFSDGGSYAVSLGVSNGDLFSSILAFSPGFIAASGLIGSPRVFISHGTQDPVLNIDRCSRRIVALLRQSSYDVQYHEFEGGHTIPPEIVDEALAWLSA